MKTMTCSMMGGPCEARITGSTPQEMIDNGMKHLKSSKDEAHQKLVNDMKNMTREDAERWQEEFMQKWEYTPD